MKRKYNTFLTAALVIGLEQTSYPVREDDQRVRVCACVKEGSIEPGTGTELVVTLSTFENTANGTPNSATFFTAEY